MRMAVLMKDIKNTFLITPMSFEETVLFLM